MNQKLVAMLQRIGSYFAQPRLTALAQPERMFLALAVPFGILFIFLSAPFQAPDEHVHFYRAYAISTGQLQGWQVTLPKSVTTFAQTVSAGLPGNDQNKQSKKALLFEFSRRFEEQPQETTSVITSAIVSPLPYLPQTVGVLIGRLAHVPPIIIFYLGRITNFLVWLGLIFLAIRITPLHPRVFAALALMPMTLQQGTSLSPDAVTIALSFLMMAYILRILMQTAKISRSEWVMVGLLVAAVALCKSIYIIGAALLLAVPVRQFRRQRSTLPLALLVIGLGLACGVIWLRYSSTFVSVEMMNEARTPTTAGFVYIAMHPQTALPILWRSAVMHVGFEMSSFIGILGWLDTPLPGWVYPFYFGLLFFTVIFEPHDPVFLYVREKLWLGLLALVSLVVMTAMFFYPDVSVGDGIVNSPQGRYFIPVALLYFLPFSQRKWCLPPNSPAWVFTALAHALVLIVAARALLWRYYAI